MPDKDSHNRILVKKFHDEYGWGFSKIARHLNMTPQGACNLYKYKPAVTRKRRPERSVIRVDGKRVVVKRRY